MQIVVCEDEILFQKSISEKIERWQQKKNYPNIQTRFFSSSEDFLERWQKGIQVDILFLDILFTAEMNGMALARQIREKDASMLIVFITNTEAYVKEGYSVRAFRYLNKPVHYGDIAQCLDVAYKQYTIAHNEYLIITASGQRIALRYEDIVCLEAQSPYTVIHLFEKAREEKIRIRFADLVPKLPEQFIVCHRSYIANIMHIRKIKRKELTMSDGTQLPVSRQYADAINTAFDSYYQEGGSYIHVGTI